MGSENSADQASALRSSWLTAEPPAAEVSDEAEEADMAEQWAWMEGGRRKRASGKALGRDAAQGRWITMVRRPARAAHRCAPRRLASSPRASVQGAGLPAAGGRLHSRYHHDQASDFIDQPCP